MAPWSRTRERETGGGQHLGRGQQNLGVPSYTRWDRHLSWRCWSPQTLWSGTVLLWVGIMPAPTAVARIGNHHPRAAVQGMEAQAACHCAVRSPFIFVLPRSRPWCSSHCMSQILVPQELLKPSPPASWTPSETLLTNSPGWVAFGWGLTLWRHNGAPGLQMSGKWKWTRF